MSSGFWFQPYARSSGVSTGKIGAGRWRRVLAGRVTSCAPVLANGLHRACGGQRTARPTVPAPQARHIYRTTTRTKFQPRRGGIFGGRASSRAARQEPRPTKFEMSLLSGAMEDRAALLQRFRAYGAGRGEAMSQFGERLRCGKILSRENSCAASLRIIGYLPFRLHP